MTRGIWRFGLVGSLIAWAVPALAEPGRSLLGVEKTHQDPALPLAGALQSYDVVEACPCEQGFDDLLILLEPRGQEQRRGGLQVTVSRSAGEADIVVEPTLEAELRFVDRARGVVATGSSPAPAKWERQLRGTECEAVLNALAVSFVVFQDSVFAQTEQAEASSAAEPQVAVTESSSEDWAFTDGEWLLDEKPKAPVVKAGWRVGGEVGGRSSTGIQPSRNTSGALALVLQHTDVGLLRGPFAFGITSTLWDVSQSFPEASGQEGHWSSAYWSAYVQATLLTVEPTSWLRLGPALELHVGTFEVTTSALGAADAERLGLGFVNLLMLAQLGSGPVRVQVQGGLQTPVDQFTVRLGGEPLYTQNGGTALSVSMQWMGAVL